MKHCTIIVSILLLIIGCKKPFSQNPETALALPSKANKTNESVVFIAGFDEGDNTYYGNAKAYFEDKDIKVIDHLFSVGEIIQWLNKNYSSQKAFNEIHIVSHSNPWLGMALKTFKEGERVSLKTLQDASAKNKIPKMVNENMKETKIIFHSCGLGENHDLLEELKQTFTNRESPKVYASFFFNVFGGKYAAHYLAKSHYNFYPTGESPGPAALSREFKEKYSNATIDWFSALKTRHETSLGKVYSYKFNIPVEWEFTFDNKTNMPQLGDRESIMDWVSESSEMAQTLYHLNIPLEKYRWRSEVRGNKLTIKGKTTVLCVLQPILDHSDMNEYRIPYVEDSYLYQIL